MREEFLAYGDLPISATITGHRKSPAEAGLRCDLMEELTRSRGSRFPQWNFTAGTWKDKGGREEPRIRSGAE
jgi:hypothetical protein